jgi:hypothetical protein
MAAVLSTLALLAAALLHGADGAAPKPGATLMSLAKFTDPEAVCMDGSASGFYWAPATTQPDEYVLYLQGGVWCYDEASCASRCGTKSASGTCSGGLASSSVRPILFFGGFRNFLRILL